VLPVSVVAVVLLLMPAAMMTFMIRERTHVIPDRQTFAAFPLSFDGWVGRRQTLDAVYLPALGLDDYLLADFHRAGAPAMNLYVAYYESQREGGASHSPGGCLPAGGWSIDEFGTAALPNVKAAGSPLQVNRALVSKGDARLLVYYWFQERHRNLTNEYEVKAMIFWDALTRRRTDGALVRVVGPVGSGEDIAHAERKLEEFTRAAYPLLLPHLPG
jgi:EpsI family protein